MPEPGINDPDFDRPAAKPARGPQRGRLAGKRLRKQLKIPGEYAEFQLEDGRFLIDVLGEKFFLPESGESLPESMQKPFTRDNPASAGNFGGDPRFSQGPVAVKRALDRDNAQVSVASPGVSTGVRIPAETAMQDDDNEAAFTNLSFGPEEENALDVAANFLTAGHLQEKKAKPEAEEAIGGGGFRMFKLPLAADGRVNEGALVPGTVYRIPESAGGGTGQWKSGAFYNFDQKGDWRIRTAADLDAYSGASDAPTPEEREGELRSWIKSGSEYNPAVFLEEPDIAKFNDENSEGIRAVQGDDEVSFSLGAGPNFLTLPDDAAAVLVRNWDDFKPRLKLLSRLFTEDLSPEEMRRLIEAQIYKAIPESERARPSARKPDGTMYAFDDPYGGERLIANLRMRAFGEMVAGIRSGATDEELAGLIGDFQKIMLPELMGVSRLVKEFVKDMVPGLNNVRSGIHFWNDLIEIEEEWKEGDITGLVGNSALLLLDGLGMIPIVGSAFAPIRSAVKKGARAIGKAAPRLDALVAQAQLWKHARQWSNRDRKIDPSRIFGETFNELPRKVQGWVRFKTNIALGVAGQEYLVGLLRRMDPATHGQTHVTILEELRPIFGGRKARRYDGWARAATDILVEDIAGWFSRKFGRQRGHFGARAGHYEFKTGDGTQAFQDRFDDFANENPGMLRDFRGNAVDSVRNARIYQEQIPMELALADAEMRLGELVDINVIDAMTSRMLLDAMKAEYKRGTKLIGLFDYAGVYVNLLAAAGHRGRFSPLPDATEEGTY